jgi:hypothetical protein
MQNKIGRKGDRTWPKLTAPPTKKQKKTKKHPQQNWKKRRSDLAKAYSTP